MTLKKPDRYLWLRDGTYYLQFDLPPRFGGRRISVSLKTADQSRARRIRDTFIDPILCADSVMHAIELMTSAFLELRDIGEGQVKQLQSIINDGQSMTFAEAFERYQTWLAQSGKRASTIAKYTRQLVAIIGYIGENRLLSELEKRDTTALRDHMKEQGRSPRTIGDAFIIFGGFLRWLGDEGLIRNDKLLETMKIPMPTIHANNTPMILHELADAAMLCVPEWTLAPRIGRYSGMRLGEIVACCQKAHGCGIIKKDGMPCFYISAEFSKTHQERIVPIAENLKPYLKDVSEVVSYTYLDNKKYNRRIKKIAGLEECKFHSWRVYANTSMMEQGVDENLRKRILGHTGGVHFGYTAASLEQMKKALDLIP